MQNTNVIKKIGRYLRMQSKDLYKHFLSNLLVYARSSREIDGCIETGIHALMEQFHRNEIKFLPLQMSARRNYQNILYAQGYLYSVSKVGLKSQWNVLQIIQDEINERYETFRRFKVKNLDEYQKLNVKKEYNFTRICIVIDNILALLSETSEDHLGVLMDIMHKCNHAGIYFMMFSKVLNNEIKKLQILLYIRTKISSRTESRDDSEIILGNDFAYHLYDEEFMIKDNNNTFSKIWIDIDNTYELKVEKEKLEEKFRDSMFAENLWEHASNQELRFSTLFLLASDPNADHAEYISNKLGVTVENVKLALDYIFPNGGEEIQ
jgi:hypothetical protein